MAQPAAAPWKTLFGITRIPFTPGLKIPRQMSCSKTSAGSSSRSTQSIHSTAGESPASSFVRARSWPRPAIVKRTSAGSGSRSLIASPITGAPWSGV